MAVELSLSITRNSQDLENNTSNVTVRVTASWTGGSYNATGECYGQITIDGSKYSFSDITFNTGRTTSGSQVIMTKTVNVTHNDDGKKTLSCSAWFYTGVSSGTVYTSGSLALYTIPRKSTLSVSNGTLQTPLELAINRHSSSFTHTITYKCGGKSGSIATKTPATSVTWTPSLDLASQNTSGTSVMVTFTIITHDGSTDLGSNTKTISCTIPAAVKPTCSVSVTDAMGYESTYGAMIQGMSKFKIVVTPTPAYGSEIASYSVIANGAKYTSANVTTDVLKTSGTLTVTATVKDKRGRSGEASASKSVITYNAPTISKLTVHRCNSDGTANDQGDHVIVTFSGNVTPLNSKNTATYTVEYKKTTASEYSSEKIKELNNKYSVSDYIYVFAAETGSSYNVRLTVKDNFGSVYAATSASTAFTLMHWLASGLGMAIGKISELSNVLDIGFATRFFGGIMPPVLEPETDLNDVRTPNTYTGANISSNNYLNCPVTQGTFTLLVESCGEEGQVKQTYSACSKYKPERFSRFYYQGEWGEWFWTSTDEVVLYASDSGSNAPIYLPSSASHYRYLEIYYTDNNGKSGGYTKVYSPNGKTIHLQLQEAGGNVYIRQTAYTISGTFITPDTDTASYVRFTAVSGNDPVTISTGTNYIKIVRVVGRA